MTEHNLQIEMVVTPYGNALAQLSEKSGLNSDQLTEAASKGAVWVKRKKGGKHRRIRSLGDGAAVGDLLCLNFNKQVLAETEMTPTLISDQVNFSVWDKPSGMLCQGSKWGDHCTITQVVQATSCKSTHLVHRLDKAASGLILVAHTRNALKKLTALFEQRAVCKHYAVKVQNVFNETLPRDITTPIDGKSAKTTVLQAVNMGDTQQSELLVSIETGRKHQIRRHLTDIGYPVVGDRLYQPTLTHTENLQLVAVYLAFECPFTGKKLVFEKKNESSNQ